MISQPVYDKLPGNIQAALDDLTKINQEIEAIKLRVIQKAKIISEYKKRGMTNVRQ